MWGQLFLFCSAIGCLYFVIKRVPAQKIDLKIVLIIAILFWIISQLISSGDMIMIDDMISDLLQISIISLVLTALMIIVRNLRPVIFRYPYFLVYSPLSLPIFFLLVIDTYLIKDLIFMASQGIALIVYLLLLTEEQAIAHKKRFGFIGLLLIIISYTIYWFLLDLFALPVILWVGTFSIGILLVTDTFTKISIHQLKYMEE